jgi:hypothetical protein
MLKEIISLILLISLTQILTIFRNSLDESLLPRTEYQNYIL